MCEDLYVGLLRLELMVNVLYSSLGAKGILNVDANGPQVRAALGHQTQDSLTQEGPGIKARP